VKRIILFAILASVVVAGCPAQPLDWIQGTGETNIESADLIVAVNEPVIPSSPFADTDFTARFTVKNVHEKKKAENVSVWIYDTGKCEILKIGGLEPEKVGSEWAGLNIQTAEGIVHRTDFAPGQEERIRLDMRAPTSSEIAGLPYTCPIRYRITYDFVAASSVTVDVMSSDRLKQIETQTGQRPSYARTLNVGPGPIRIFIEPRSSLPVESGRKLRLELIVQNDGTGEFPSIEPGKLVLKLPKDFEPVLSDGKLCGGFFEVKGEEENIVSYVNFRKIDLIEKKSNAIMCEFAAPDVAVEKEYTITAELPYSYGYFGKEISVPITAE